ncbi:DUF483 domain-containing protein [Nanoarchaeota archaeon]
MINSLLEAFGSLTKALELFFVLEDIKQVARIVVKDKQILKQFCKENNLEIIFSDFNVKTVSLGGYSNQGIINKEQGDKIAYISKNKLLANKAKTAEKEMDHKELGLLLGYPECCCEFFAKHFPKKSKTTNDYTLETLKNSEGFEFPFQTNIAARTFDLGLISHFPCSFNCEKSIELANKNLKAIKNNDPNLAQDLPNLLKTFVIYSEKNGVIIVPEFTRKDDYIYHNMVFSNIESEIAQEVKKAELIKIQDKNKVIINNKEFDDLGVMLFQ